MAQEQGITIKKEDDFSEWYTQVITKAQLIDYTDVSGCYVFRPRSYAVWEIIQSFMNKEIKKRNVKNSYFPLFIPESLLLKEKEHVQGFTPEVAWVTHSGETELSERLAVRPTSETIMYASFKKWIRSYNDLPLKINQWCNVVRWEFKNPVPFLRSREFLWQEGHTVYSNKEDADNEVRDILHLYKKVFEELLAVPVWEGIKSENEKFAGADYTTSIETFLPIGKGIQCATSHSLGQNFSKAFDITFIDKDEKIKHAWQNSWGLSTRSIGIMVMYHSDNKGLILPPRVAENKCVLIPIIFEGKKEMLLKKCIEIKNMLNENSDLNIFIDDDEQHSPGWKFSEWEMKGIPIRLELGPKDLEKDQVVVVRRDTGEKLFVKCSELKNKINEVLIEIHNNLFSKAKHFISQNTIETHNWDDIVKSVENKKLVKTVWCENSKCEDLIKEKLGGAKTLNMPFEQGKIEGVCAHCKSPGKTWVMIGKSY